MVDASVIPLTIGAHPQLTVYAIAGKVSCKFCAVRIVLIWAAGCGYHSREVNTRNYIRILFLIDYEYKPEFHPLRPVRIVTQSDISCLQARLQNSDINGAGLLETLTLRGCRWSQTVSTC